jgi:malonyl-CoA decarboxylase
MAAAPYPTPENTVLDDMRQAAARQRTMRSVRRLKLDCKRLLSEKGELGGMALARDLIDRLELLADEHLDEFFDYLAQDLSPDPKAVLARAQAYAAAPGAATLMALTDVAEPPRQELLRRLNRMPGGTAAVLRLRRALLRLLPQRPELAAIESDLLHLLTSWFNPGFLQMKRVDWNSPAQLLEKIIHHEAVHAIDGWDDLRRRLQPDRRCFAFFHPQLGGEPLIFVEVALLPEVPEAIAPLIDKASTPLTPDKFRVAAFYSISNCEPGLRGVSLGNFLIKTVATQLERELPRLRTFCTLSPIPGFAAWLLGEPDFHALPGIRKAAAAELQAAQARLRQACQGELAALQGAAAHERLGDEDMAALRTLCAAFLTYLSPTPAGDPVARFHLDNGARLERLNPRGNLSAKGLRQSFGLMVNYLYDLAKVEASHAKFRQGEVARSRAVGVPT